MPGFGQSIGARIQSFGERSGEAIAQSGKFDTPLPVIDLARLVIDRNARKGKQPSDHAPVIVDLTD